MNTPHLTNTPQLTRPRQPHLHGLSIGRRDLLRVGGAGLLGLTLPRWMRGQAAAQASLRSLPIRAKSVIFLFQWGGPSHLDTFDMKPEAPDTIRSPYKAISSSVPGLPVCELLPEMAKRMDKVTLVRSVTHSMNNHNSAGYYALTGHAPAVDDQRLRDSLDLFPAYGSVVDHFLDDVQRVVRAGVHARALLDGLQALEDADGGFAVAGVGGGLGFRGHGRGL